MLIQIIYTSQAFGFDDTTLAGILLDARRCNLRDDITGSLLCRHDIYLQLLEGPEDRVDACFARIGADDRHVNVRLISRAEISERLFPGWAMRDDPASSEMWTIADVEAGAPARATPDEVLAMFRQIAAKSA